MITYDGFERKIGKFLHKNGQKFGNLARIVKNRFTDEIRQKKMIKNSKIAITSLELTLEQK